MNEGAYNASDRSCAYLNIRGCCIVMTAVLSFARYDTWFGLVNIWHAVRIMVYSCIVLKSRGTQAPGTGSLKCTTCRGSRVARRPTESLWISDF